MALILIYSDCILIPIRTKITINIKSVVPIRYYVHFKSILSLIIGFLDDVFSFKGHVIDKMFIGALDKIRDINQSGSV